MSVWCGVRRSGSRMWERLIQARARSEREGWDEKEGALQSADVCRVGPVAGVAMRLAGRFATTLARPPCRLPVSRPDELSAHCPPPAARPRLLLLPLSWAGRARRRRWSLVAGRSRCRRCRCRQPPDSEPPPSSSPSPASGVGGSATKVKPRLCAAARYRCPPTHSLE
jgi:hypothetical protein